MEISIRSKDYSFPEAFDVVGGKLVPAWTGKEIEARKCHSPEDVKSTATQPERFVQYVEKNPGLDIADLQTGRSVGAQPT